MSIYTGYYNLDDDSLVFDDFPIPSIDQQLEEIDQQIRDSEKQCNATYVDWNGSIKNCLTQSEIWIVQDSIKQLRNMRLQLLRELEQNKATKLATTASFDNYDDNLDYLEF